jgi:hypothetical protein
VAQGEPSYPAAAGAALEAIREFLDHEVRGIDNGWQQRPGIRFFQSNENAWTGADVRALTTEAPAAPLRVQGAPVALLVDAGHPSSRPDLPVAVVPHPLRRRLSSSR